MDDIPSRYSIFQTVPLSREEVSSRDLLCRPLRALRDNRAEAEQTRLDLGNGSAAAASVYRPGLYMTMDWVASRMKRIGAVLWGMVFGLDEVEILSIVEYETITAVTATLI